MEPDTPLWREVVAEEGLGAVWPVDNEDSVRQLQATWSRLADNVGEGGFQVSQAAGVVESSWPDPAGSAAVDAVTAYFDRIKETSLQMAWIGTHCLSYASKIEETKNAVRDRIAGWEQAYAAAGVPRFGKDTAHHQSLVVLYAAQACFKIIDDAARDIRTTLLSKAVDEERQDRKGTLDVTRQVGNVFQLLDSSMRDLNRWNLLYPLTIVKTAEDVNNGESVGQAFASNWLSFGANIGTSTALGAAAVAAGSTATAGAAIGMLGGLTVSAFVSGAVDSMYENGPTHLGTALARGGEEVVNTYEGIGDWVGDRFSGQGN